MIDVTKELESLYDELLPLVASLTDEEQANLKSDKMIKIQKIALKLKKVRQHIFQIEEIISKD